MALNVTQTIVDAAWTALEARSGFTTLVRPHNRAKSADVGWRKLLDTRTAPADFPFVHIFATGRTSGRAARSFGLNEDVDTFDYGQPMTVTLDVRAAFDFLADAKVTPLEAEIEAALHVVNVDLVASAIRPAPLEWRASRSTENVGGQNRIVVTWTATADCRPMLSSLVS